MTTLLEIQGCAVSQWIAGGGQDIPLSQGPLALFKDAELSLICGTSAFALTGSKFFTHADSPRIYFFEPSFGAVKGSGTYIKILLPESVIEPNSDAEKQRDQLESILIDHDLLQDAPISTEYIGRALSDAGSRGANSLDSKTATHIASTESTSTTFSQSTHNAVSAAKDYTGLAAQYTSKAIDSLNSIVISAGEKVGHAVGADKFASVPESEKTDARKQVESGLGAAKEGFTDIGTGISDGAGKIFTSATSNADKAISHDYGTEASDLAGQAGQTAANAGSILVDGAQATSTVMHGIMLGKGTTQAAQSATDEPPKV